MNCTLVLKSEVLNVPAERGEFPSLLNDGMKEGHSEQYRFPLRQIGNVEEVLSDAGVGPLQASPDTLETLIRVRGTSYNSDAAERRCECPGSSVTEVNKLRM